ncbi:hypothetical protein HYDPIDRAFT_108361 [Hydnomerulius pinastri MD-312]|nr:hypothetical protein HYDPIDRAFT_108361 [Hydnomerulius pinastri MD-312]
MGFNQPNSPDIDKLSPYDQAHDLLRTLSDGVDLLVLCTRRDRITKSLLMIYRLFQNLFFGGEARIALIITHLEWEGVMEDWWKRNERAIANLGIQCVQHACITAAKDNDKQEDTQYAASKQAVIALLHECTASNSPMRLSLAKNVASQLKDLCGLDDADAMKLARRWRVPNVVLFGETGVGKSSVINLIAGEKIATISGGLEAGTLDYRGYTLRVGRNQIRIYDTVGLNEPDIGITGYAKAVENASRLVHSLHQEGGVNLLLFCIQASRVSDALKSNYRLFHEFLCEKQVPIVLIVTHLENEQRMDDWWVRNERTLGEKYQIKVTGHACITATSDPEGRHQAALETSKQSVQTMLDNWTNSWREQFTKEEKLWIATFVQNMFTFVRGGADKARDNVAKLKKRCHIPEEHARAIAEMVSQARD